MISTQTQSDFSLFYDDMKSDRVVFTYKGFLDNLLLNSLLASIELELISREDDVATRKKMFSVLIECLQNAVIHSDSLPPENGHPNRDNFSLLLVTCSDDAYCIRTGNPVLNSKVPELKAWLETLNLLSPEELKHSYRKLLDGGEWNDKGMAGLGFVNIARKSDRQLEYSFNKLNDCYSIFSFLIHVPRNTKTKKIRELWNH